MLKKIFSYGIIEAVTKGLNKLTALILPLFLTTEGYGKVGLIISLEMLIPFITILGFEKVVLRFYHQRDSIPGLVSTIFNSIIFTHASLFLISCGMLLVGVKEFIGLSVYPELQLLIALIYLQCYNRLVLLFYRVEGNHKDYYRAKLITQISKFIFILGFVYFDSSPFAYLLGSIFVSFSLNLYYRSIKIKGESFNSTTFKTIFKFSWPFIFHGIAMNALGNADKFVILSYLSLKEVGEYTLIYSIGSMIYFAFIGISVYMEPLIYKAETLYKRDKLLNVFIMYTLFAGLGLFGIISVLSNTILPIYYGEKYGGVLKYIPYISASFLLYPYYLASNYKLVYEKRTAVFVFLSTIASVLSVLLNVYFVPKIGIFGAVMVNLISYMLQILLFMLIAYGWRSWKNLLIITFVNIAVCLMVINELSSFYVFLFMLFYALCFFLTHKNDVLYANAE
jgi:O-antigen/teichoic acid export membrane protein